MGNNRKDIKVEDVVLIHDKGPRLDCKLAVVEELIVGGDGLVRAANIRTSNGKTNRPIVKLFPLSDVIIMTVPLQPCSAWCSHCKMDLVNPPPLQGDVVMQSKFFHAVNVKE